MEVVHKFVCPECSVRKLTGRKPDRKPKAPRPTVTPVLSGFIRMRRVSLDMSPRWAATQLFISPETLSNWERGTVTIPYQKLPRIAELLDVPVRQLTELQETDSLLKSVHRAQV